MAPVVTKMNETMGTPFYPAEALQKFKKKAVIVEPARNDLETRI
jgi:hypothetical protein